MVLTNNTTCLLVKLIIRNDLLVVHMHKSLYWFSVIHNNLPAYMIIHTHINNICMYIQTYTIHTYVHMIHILHTEHLQICIYIHTHVHICIQHANTIHITYTCIQTYIRIYTHYTQIHIYICTVSTCT